MFTIKALSHWDWTLLLTFCDSVGSTTSVAWPVAHIRGYAVWMKLLATGGIIANWKTLGPTTLDCGHVQ